MQSADDAIIGAWRDEIISDPNAYVLARVDEVESKPKFGPFNDRLNHPQIQTDMLPLAAHAIADATTWIAFLPTTDEKIDTLNMLIKHYKRLKKSTWKNVKEDMDKRIKKITAMDIFILMCKDLKSRLRPSFLDRMTQSLQSFTSTTRRTRQPTTPGKEYEMKGMTGMTGGSKRRKSKKSKNSMKIRNIRRTRKSRV